MTESRSTFENSFHHCSSCGARAASDERSMCPSCGAVPGQTETILPLPAAVIAPGDSPRIEDSLDLANLPNPPAGSGTRVEPPDRSGSWMDETGHPDPMPAIGNSAGGVDPPTGALPVSIPVQPPTPVKSAPRSARNQTAAFLGAAALAVTVFTGILLWLHNTGKPVLTEVGGGAQNSAAASPGVIGTGSSQAPNTVAPGSIQTNGSAGTDPAASADSPLQIYWRPATAEYFTEHPSIPTTAVHIPDGYSASLVRIDVENTGSVPIAVQPSAFLLTAPGAYASLSRQRLPGFLTASTVSGHGSVRGWLLFIKPWWDVTSDGQTVSVRLVYGAPPGAHINLSNHAPSHPTPVPSAAPGGWIPQHNETTYSV